MENLLLENIHMFYPPFKITDFMRESNAIEGEFEDGGVRGRLNPGDIEAVHLILGCKKLTLERLLKVHEKLGEYLEAGWVGKVRHVDVRVGAYKAPKWQNVPGLINDYIEKYPKMDSFEAYNEFEMIHPHQDLNGRVGRLLWLKKALKEGYAFGIPFLQKYHYQCLDNFNSLIVKKC